MTRDELQSSATLALALGAALGWIGAWMLRRPVQAWRRLRFFLRRGRRPPDWARPDPVLTRSATRRQGAILLAVGLGLVVLGAYEWWLSRM